VFATCHGEIRIVVAGHEPSIREARGTAIVEMIAEVERLGTGAVIGCT
jgi:uncharacterized protein YbjQ (UPF0145 family)